MDDQFEESEEVFTEGAFEPLSSDVRREIVRNAERQFSGVEVVSFSELLEMGPLDDRGHLRYHVDKLDGALLTKIEEGYRPLFGSIREAIGYNAAKSGRDSPFRARVLTGYRCPHCPELASVGYSNAERLFFHCPRHGLVFSQELPPSVSSADPTDWIDLGIRTMHLDLERLDMDFCPRCNGPVDGSLVREGLTYSSRIESKAEELVLWADFRCVSCEYEVHYPAATRAVTDDRVRRFFTDHGIDIRTRPFPNRFLDTFGVYEEDDAGNPVQARLDYALDGSALTVEVDESASIVSVDDSYDGTTGTSTNRTHTVYSPETAVTEVITDDEFLVVTTRAGDSYGVCPRTGELQWSVPTTGSSTRPVIHGNTVYLGGLDEYWEDGVEKDQERNQLFAVECQSGDVVWRQRVDGRPSRGMTVVDDSLVVPSVIHGLHVLNRVTGEPIWSEPFDPEGIFSLVTDGGSIGYGAGWEAMYGVDLAERETIWTHRTDETSLFVRVVDDVVCISTRAGVTALDMHDGSRQWSRETRRGPRGLAVARNSVIVNTVDAVHCLRSNGEQHWTWSGGRPTYTTPETDSENVYVGTDEGSLHALDLETGREVWAARTTSERPLRSTISASSESVFVGDGAGGVYAIDKSSGEINWQAHLSQ